MALSKAQKIKIQALYETGEFSFSELAKKFKSSKATMFRACKGVKRGQTSHLVEATMQLEKAKRNESETTMRAVQVVADKKSEVQRMDELTNKTISKVNLLLGSAMVEDIQKKKENKKLQPEDIDLYSRTAKILRQTTKLNEPREPKVQVEQSLQVAQLMSTEEKTEIPATSIAEMDASQLSARFKARGLPS